MEYSPKPTLRRKGFHLSLYSPLLRKGRRRTQGRNMETDTVYSALPHQSLIKQNKTTPNIPTDPPMEVIAQLRFLLPSYMSVSAKLTKTNQQSPFPQLTVLSQAKRNIMKINFSLKTFCQPNAINLELSSAKWDLAWDLSTTTCGFIPTQLPKGLHQSCVPARNLVVLIEGLKEYSSG